MKPVIMALAIALVAPASTGAPTLRPAGEILGPDGYSDYSVVDPDHDTLYVGRADGVMAVDLHSHHITPHFVPGRRTHAIVLLPGDLGAATNGALNTVSLFRRATGAPIAEIGTGGLKPDAATYDPVSKTVAIVNGRTGTVTFLDTIKQVITASVGVGAEPEAAVADGKGLLYVALSEAGGFAVVDTRRSRLVATHIVAGCADATGLALDAANNALLLSCADDHVVVAALDTGRVLARLPIGPGCDELIADPVRAQWLATSDSGSVTFIRRNGGHYLVAARVTVTPGARSGALDASRMRLYLPTLRYRKGEEGDEAVPGSFRVIAYDLTGGAR